MAQTVIGIFQKNAEAQNAFSRLVANGVDRANINMALPDESESRGDITDVKNTLGSRIGIFFRNIFADTDEALRYAAVAQRGVTMAVHTETYEEAERIADILDSSGALNIDESARVLEDSMTREDRKYNLKQGDGEINTPAPDFNTRPSSNIAADSERQVPGDKRAKPVVRLRTRIIETPIGSNVRIREEQIWLEKPPHDRVDEQGNLHKDGL